MRRSRVVRWRLSVYLKRWLASVLLASVPSSDHRKKRMLLKEKLYLSNCDSVRQLQADEVHKRFMLGLAFSDGVVLSPNTLLDNGSIDVSLQQGNVRKYLNEEGAGKLVLRGHGLERSLRIQDYFDALPADYIVSSLDGVSRKGQMSRLQRDEIKQRLDAIDGALGSVLPEFEPLQLAPTSLHDEIFRRLNDPEVMGHFFTFEGDLALFCLQTQALVSRSQWYAFINDYAQKTAALDAAQFRMEVIDPAYHSLFVKSGEGFMQDKIRYLTGIPPQLLDATISFRALRRELNLILYPYKLFQFVSALGAGELVKFLTEAAVDFLEDQAVDRGMDYCTRRNWFGLYPRLRDVIGLEIK